LKLAHAKMLSLELAFILRAQTHHGYVVEALESTISDLLKNRVMLGVAWIMLVGPELKQNLV